MYFRLKSKIVQHVDGIQRYSFAAELVKVKASVLIAR